MLLSDLKKLGNMSVTSLWLRKNLGLELMQSDARVHTRLVIALLFCFFCIYRILIFHVS